MKETIKQIFVPFGKTIPEKKKGILIMDNFKAHYDGLEIPKLIREAGFKLLLLPPNTTSELQPNDLGINHILKLNYRYFWEQYYINKSSTKKTMSNEDIYLGLL